MAIVQTIALKISNHRIGFVITHFITPDVVLGTQVAKPVLWTYRQMNVNDVVNIASSSSQKGNALMLFGDWIEKTRALQVDAYGQDPADLEGEELANFLRWNFLASQVELAESLAELPWKPWSEKHRARAERFRGTYGVMPDAEHIARNAAVEEIVDVLHFVANILCALECDDGELNERYLFKMKINADRQTEGY